MKRKAIEQIPPVPAGKEETDFPYRAAAAIVEIDNKKHLIIDIYRTRQPEELLIRMAINKNEYQNYNPQNDTWDRKKLDIWDVTGQTESINSKSLFFSKKDTNKIKTYTKEATEYCMERAWYLIRNYQERINMEQTEKKRVKKDTELNTRIRETPEIPEGLKLWVRQKFHHYLFYKRTGNWAEIQCSNCGSRYTIRTKETTGSMEEAMAEPWGRVPKHNQYGSCKLCRNFGIFKAEGKQQRIQDTQHVYLAQKYKEGDRSGIVVRYINCYQTAYKDHEKMELVEIERAYFIKGARRVQIDYQKHSCWDDRDFWDYKNLESINKITRERGLYYDSRKELEETEFEYTGIEEYVQKKGKADLIDFFMGYRNIPELEMVVKMKLWDLAERITDTRGNPGDELDLEAKTPWDKLKIRKTDLPFLVKKEGEKQILKILQFEKEYNFKLQEAQREMLRMTGFREYEMWRILPYMSMTKFLNRIQKYAGIDMEAMIQRKTVCTSAERNLAAVAGRYTDYLIMRLDLGYDLHNTVFQHPRNLTEDHQKMVLEQNKKENEKRIREMQEKYSEIEKNYKKYRKKYRYEKENLIIRPAKNAGEIIREGQALHHCVGNETYIKNHDAGKSLILFLRKKEQPDQPYVTIEIDTKSGKIQQWYGANDRKPDEKHLTIVLQQYENYLQRKKTEVPAEAAG